MGGTLDEKGVFVWSPWPGPPPGAILLDVFLSPLKERKKERERLRDLPPPLWRRPTHSGPGPWGGGPQWARGGPIPPPTGRGLLTPQLDLLEVGGLRYCSWYATTREPHSLTETHQGSRRYGDDDLFLGDACLNIATYGSSFFYTPRWTLPNWE